MSERVSVKIGNSELIIETGKMAKQADGAVTVQYGETVVFTASCASRKAEPGRDFFPLTVDYREKTYAAGKIPGGFFKREGRPTEREVLTSRLIDRPIRPLFPENFLNEVSVSSIVFSMDGLNCPDIPAIIGASASLAISGIPFQEPVGAVRVGRLDGQYIINPTFDDLEATDLDLVLVGTEKQVVMIEAGAGEVSEEDFLKAIQLGHDEIKKIVKIQLELQKKCGKEKWVIEAAEIPADVRKKIESVAKGKFNETLFKGNKDEQAKAVEELYAKVLELFDVESDEFNEAQVKSVFKELEYEGVRDLIVNKKKRPDGRNFEDIRKVTCEVGVLPRTHGSSLFTRGETQSLSVATLGTKDDMQKIDALEGASTRRFMLHYNFPSFSVGECRPSRGPGRREIGHGALAERALSGIIPDAESFPYTLRLVSEILESNGSSSMATVCGGTLALMDAGVPIKAPVAGIAMGLVKEGDKWEVLTDIAGLEDHLGDMDFKVAGTVQGITALQMDIKIGGIDQKILTTALTNAKKARLSLLEIMNKTIGQPREELSVHAPRITTLQVNTNKIKDIIGPGGKNIKKIIEQTGVTIDIEDSGKVFIASSDSEASDRAIEWIKSIVEEAEVGKIYKGTVKKIMPFGAFCEIMPGTEGLCHVSELSDKYVDDVEKVVKVGDTIPLKVIKVDQNGRISLSYRQAQEEVESK